jgi:carbamoyltransferase
LNILGLHLGHDSTAALIVDNRLVGMVERERLTRIKYDRGFMPEMIDKCLKLGGIGFRDVDYVALSLASGSEESAKIRLDDTWGITIIKEGKKYINGPRQLNPWEMEEGITVKFDGIEKQAYQIQHQISHAASSYYLSGFDQAIALTYDGSGFPAEQTSLICKCEGNRVVSEGVPNLNGALLYGMISRFIYGTYRDSGKLMGLSAYGEPTYYFDDFMKDPTIKGMINNLNIYWHEPEKLKDLYKASWNQNRIKNIAASTQKWMEEDVKRVLNFIDEKYGEECNIVNSGGGALNVICNRIIHNRHNLFCAPFPKDDGLAIGGALYLLHHVFDEPRENYTTKDITFLGGGDSSWEQYPTTQIHLETEINLPEIAKEISEGKVVFWHQGRSEVGPRALTHRSILAKAEGMKKRVSEDIKGREEYRPLAPIVLAEDCEDWFDVSPNALTDLMLLNAKVKQPDKIPDVTHVDGTARVQTISEEFNPIVHKLLKAYKEVTGTPVLINTSLNIQGQAICETKRDTLWTFDNSDANICVVDNEVYTKERALV